MGSAVQLLFVLSINPLERPVQSLTNFSVPLHHRPQPDTSEWFAWVAKQDSFRFMGKGGHFTAHHEWRVPRGACQAHRKIRNHGYTLRLAPSQDVTIAILEQAAEALQAHLT